MNVHRSVSIESRALLFCIVRHWHIQVRWDVLNSCRLEYVARDVPVHGVVNHWKEKKSKESTTISRAKMPTACVLDIAFEPKVCSFPRNSTRWNPANRGLCPFDYPLWNEEEGERDTLKCTDQGCSSYRFSSSVSGSKLLAHCKR